MISQRRQHFLWSGWAAIRSPLCEAQTGKTRPVLRTDFFNAPNDYSREYTGYFYIEVPYPRKTEFHPWGSSLAEIFPSLFAFCWSSWSGYDYSKLLFLSLKPSLLHKREKYSFSTKSYSSTCLRSRAIEENMTGRPLLYILEYVHSYVEWMLQQKDTQLWNLFLQKYYQECASDSDWQFVMVYLNKGDGKSRYSKCWSFPFC